MSTEKPTECRKCGRDFDSYKAMRTHQSRVGHMKKPWRDEGRLEELYVQRGLSAYNIADELGCGAATVYEALDDFGIERRSGSKTKRIQSSREPANYRTHSRDGYEEVYTQASGENQFARVHRLCAVAWFGYENVVDSVVHHKKPVEWLNTEENLELMDSQSEHAKEHSGTRERDSGGQYV